MLSHADNNISDEEFVPLYDCYRSKNPDFGYQSNDVFDPENMNSPVTAKPNFELRKVRVSVEWLLGDIINSFRFLDYKKNLKIGLSSVGKMYLVRALLLSETVVTSFIVVLANAFNMCCYTLNSLTLF